MMESSVGRKAARIARWFGGVALLTLAGWNLTAGAAGVPMQTEGAFSVKPDGSANYSVAVDAPPGTAGMTPAISLAYSSAFGSSSSQHGDGILGVGWSLSGLPTITRCPQTIVQDGKTIGVNFTASDRFCYDGQRLVAVSGAYGADGTTYRTEIDEFSLITSHGTTSGPNGMTGPAYWTVQTKAGRTLEFGRAATSPNSFVQAVIPANAAISQSGPSGVARSWALDKVWDHLGNYYVVSYSAESATTGETEPTEIDYTGNSNTGVTPYNKIVFFYNQNGMSRTHPIISHLAGTVSETTQVLTDIYSYAGPALVHDYHLAYTTDAVGRPELNAVYQCDGASPQTCLPPVQFGWTATNPPSSAPTTPHCSGGPAANNPNSMSGWVPFIADLNNDGKDDILWVDEAAPTATLPGPNGLYRIWYSNGDGTFNCYIPTFSSDSSNYPSALSSVASTWRGTPYLGDFTGSGRTDILLRPAGGGIMQFWTNSGDSTGSFSYVTNGPQNTPQPGVPMAVADFQGNGLSSLVWMFQAPLRGDFPSYNSRLSCVDINITPGTGNYQDSQCAFAQWPLFQPAVNDYYYILTGDFNGDGKADVLLDSYSPLVVGQEDDGFDRKMFTSNGDGTFSQVSSFSLPSAINQVPADITVADVNGDGIADLIFNPRCNAAYVSSACGTWTEGYQTTGQLVVLLGRGDGTFDPAPTFQSGAPLTNYRVIPGRFSGTGFTDLLMDQEDENGVSTGNQVLFISNGDGTFTQQTWQLNTTYKGSMAMVGDFVGLGQDSALWNGVLDDSYWQTSANVTDLRSNGSLAVALASTTLPPSDLVNGITSGLGAQTAISYQTLSQYSLYTKGTGSIYPTVDLQDSRPVVESVLLPDGLGSTLPYVYAYAGAKSDLNGRGDLGFSTFIVIDESQLSSQYGNVEIQTATYFNQKFPLTGLPTTKTVSEVTNPGTSNTIQSLSVSSTTYDQVSEFSGTGVPTVWFVNQNSTTVNSNDLNGAKFPALTSSTSYDCDTAPSNCYGNAVKLTQSRDVGYQTVTTYQYGAGGSAACAGGIDIANWLIDEPCSVTVQDTVPAQSTAPGSTASRSNTYNYAVGTGLLSGSTVEPGAGAPLQIATNYGYDNYGNRTTTTLVPSDSQSFTQSTVNWATGSPNYNSGPQYNQFPQTGTDALGYKTQYGWNTSFGSIIYSSDINSLVSTVQYDTFGRPILALKPDGTGTKTAYAYCSTVSAGCGYAITVTPVDKNGATIGAAVKTTYDSLERPVQIDTMAFDGQSDVRVVKQYNTVGEVTQISQPYLVGQTQYWTRYTYDALTRVITVTDADNSTTQRTYNGLVQTDTMPTESGPYGGTEQIVKTRNGLGQTVSVQDAIKNLTKYGYAPFGNLASVTDQATNTVSYTYDALGRKTAISDPDAGQMSIAWNSLGQVAGTTEPNALGTGTVSTSYTYDLLGRKKSRTEPDLVSTWTYDVGQGALGKLTTAATESAAAAGNPSAYAGYPGGFSRSYSYDTSGRLSKTTQLFGNLPAVIFQNSYAPLGQGGAGELASVSDSASGAAVNYGYTAQGYLQQLTRSGSGLSAAASVYSIASEDASFRPGTITYGSAAFTNSLSTTTTLTDTYCYDSLNQLREADTTTGTALPCNTNQKTVTYDGPTGNIVNKSDVGTYGYGAAGSAGPHQLKSITSGGTTVGYTADARGNVTNGENAEVFTWSSFNRAATVTEGTSEVQYYYDADHERIAVQATTGGAVQATKLYLRDGTGALSAELWLGAQGNWTQVVDYFSAKGSLVGALSTLINNSTAASPAGTPGTATMAYLHTDGRGSVTAISDDTGKVSEFDSYDPWGKRRSPTTGADDTGNTITSASAYGYIQQEQIAGIANLMNLNARLYNPHIGRFMSTDPIGLAGGRNVYAYSGNNPTTASDPSGLEETEGVNVTAKFPGFGAPSGFSLSDLVGIYQFNGMKFAVWQGASHGSPEGGTTPQTPNSGAGTPKGGSATAGVLSQQDIQTLISWAAGIISGDASANSPLTLSDGSQVVDAKVQTAIQVNNPVSGATGLPELLHTAGGSAAHTTWDAKEGGKLNAARDAAVQERVQEVFPGSMDIDMPSGIVEQIKVVGQKIQDQYPNLRSLWGQVKWIYFDGPGEYYTGNGTVWAQAFYKDRAVVIFKDTTDSRISAADQNFIIGHEFRHLQDENYELLRQTTIEDVVGKPHEDLSFEVDANRWSMRLNNLNHIPDFFHE